MRASVGISLSTVMLSVLLTACGGSGSGGGSAQPAAVSGTETAAKNTEPSPSASAAPALIESRVQTPELAATDVSPFKDRPVGRAPTPRHVVLPALPPESAVPLKSAPAIFGTPTKIGVARQIAETATVQAVSSMMSWTPSERGGKVAALRFASPNAKGVRTGLRVDSLPPGTMVRFYGDASPKIYEVSAQEILTVIQRNLDAGDSSDNARTYWSPNMGGEALTVEIEVPPNAVLEAVKVAVPMLSHVSIDITKQASLEKVGEAGSCNLDVTCASQYDTLSKSVALMHFIDSGSNYVCTGTLLRPHVDGHAVFPEREPLHFQSDGRIDSLHLLVLQVRQLQQHAGQSGGGRHDLRRHAALCGVDDRHVLHAAEFTTAGRRTVCRFQSLRPQFL
ncbi:hypothetical protein [Variovorax sp. Root411]|uniref:hypothetical protein n=1 Tax=Variovorax sp. Root411 TaxID=1736530 RepID=UPI001F3EC82A|nr:hypothetical protein [Variovorax sp. Root411]